MKTPFKFADRLSNLITGLGMGNKDKTVQDQFQFVTVDDSQLEFAYRGDWLARKIVDIIPFDMTREGWNWQAKESQIERLEDTEKKFCVLDKVFMALVRARLFGGSGLYIGTKVGSPTDELLPEQMVRDGITYIHGFTRRDLAFNEIETDPVSPWFGMPKMFQLTISGSQQAAIEIHPSRVITFSGMPHPDPMRAGSQDFWGDSVLQIMLDAIKNAVSGQQHVAALIPEAKIDVVQVPGLSDMLSTDVGTAKVTKRFQEAAIIKSLFGMVLLEGDNEGNGEQYQQKQIRFTEFPDLLRQYLQVASGAADVPVTRLLGQSPSGLNATGDADIRNYYDNVKARQKRELKPRLDRLMELLIRHTFGSRPKSIYYEFAPLWQMSAKDAADIEKITAETEGLLVTSALVPAPVMEKATRNRLIESGRYPGIEDAYEEFDNDPEQQALANAAKGLDPDGKPTPADPNDPENDPEADPNDKEGASKKPGGSIKLKVVASKDAAPRSLYVRRDLLNKSDIYAWARAQGFTTVLEDLHVTIVHTHVPIDWFKVYTAEPRLEVPQGGARMVEHLGNKGAIVLLFKAETLEWRYDHFKNIGAQTDYDEYTAHVTLTYNGANLDLEMVEPYKGKLLFGPELFEEVDRNWQGELTEREV